jgi:U6 snRNA-associated Sm-like protein LSm8
VTCDGRIIIGTLVGHDQVQNLVLNEAHERVYSIDDDVEQVTLGLYVIRGDNVALIGEAEDWKDDLKVEPLPEIHQNVQ